MARRRPSWSTGAPTAVQAAGAAPVLRKQRHPSSSGVRDAKDTEDFSFHTYARPPPLTRAHRSALADVLLAAQPGLFDALSDRRTADGFTLSNLMQSGLEHPERARDGPGVAVGDVGCWATFRELLFPLLREVQGVDPAGVRRRPARGMFDPEPGALAPQHLARELALASPTMAAAAGGAGAGAGGAGVAGAAAGTRAHETASEVRYVELRAVRNLGGAPLPVAADRRARAALERTLRTALESFAGALAGEYTPLYDDDDDDDDDGAGRAAAAAGGSPRVPGVRVEEGAGCGRLRGAGVPLPDVSEGGLLASSGAARGWPMHRGVFVAAGGALVVWINALDHVEVISRAPTIGAAFGRLQGLLLGLQVSLLGTGSAFLRVPSPDEQLGLHTTCPSMLGAAMRGAVHARLPALERAAAASSAAHAGARGGEHRLRAAVAAHGLRVRRRPAQDKQHGEAEAGNDSVWELSTWRTLGLSAEQVALALARGVRGVLGMEREAAGGAASGSLAAALVIRGECEEGTAAGAPPGSRAPDLRVPARILV
jgi:hypothetical protein